MFSPNSFYDYLRYYFNTTKKESIIRSFRCPGDNNLFNMLSCPSNRITPYLPTLSTNEHIAISIDTTSSYTDGYCNMFDQDPLNLYSIFKSSLSQLHKLHINSANPIVQKNLRVNKQFMSEMDNPTDLFLLRSAAIHHPLLCHSEKQSIDVNTLSMAGFIPVHYWYHAFISLHWFGHYKFLVPTNNQTSKRFGLYVRDASGSRSYRIRVLELLSPINDKVYFKLNHHLIPQLPANSSILHKWDKNTEEVSSDSSASIEWTDEQQFDIHIIPETLFDTTKTHLTEKSFKPIVMGQPFIMIGCPNSLRYIKTYGFKTFDSVWDESYDTEPSPTVRLEKIKNLIYAIAKLSVDEYQKLLSRANQIARYNREYFYSTKFETLLINELHNELDTAFHIREEKYHTNPGGTYFYIMDKLYHQKKLNDDRLTTIKQFTKHIKTYDPTTHDLIIKKYSHLL